MVIGMNRVEHLKLMVKSCLEGDDGCVVVFKPSIREIVEAAYNFGLDDQAQLQGVPNALTKDVKECLRENGSLFSQGWYLHYEVGNSTACLDGYFTAQDLLSIGHHMLTKGDENAN